MVFSRAAGPQELVRCIAPATHNNLRQIPQFRQCLVKKIDRPVQSGVQSVCAQAVRELFGNRKRGPQAATAPSRASPGSGKSTPLVSRATLDLKREYGSATIDGSVPVHGTFTAVAGGHSLGRLRKRHRKKPRSKWKVKRITERRSHRGVEACHEN